MSEIQSNNPIKMEDLIETFDSSAEGTVEAINKIHTSAETRKSAEDSMNERRLSLSTQIATYSTNVALDAGVPDAYLRTKRKQGSDNASSISSEDNNDTTIHKDEDSLMLGNACTGLFPTSEVVQRKTRDERRDVRVFSGPIDPKYARILGSTTFSSSHGQDRSTRAVFSQSSSIRREDKDTFGASNASEDVTNILSDWNRRHRRNDNDKLILLGDSRDATYTRILSSDTALAPVNGTNRIQQVSTVKPDKEYGHIIRQHEFSFQPPSPARDVICPDCDIRKPVTQYSGYRQICNDCYAAKLSSEGSYQISGKRSTQAFGRICGSCSEPKRGDGFRKVNGRSICSDCSTIVRGFRELTDQSSSNRPYSSSSDSETSKISLPKVSAKTEAELLAILATNKEITSSQTSVSESRHSLALNREPGIQNPNNLQNPRVSVARSPSVIFLHESKGDVSPQEDAQLQDIKATIKRLFSQYLSSEQEAKRLKRQDSQQDLIVFEDTS